MSVLRDALLAMALAPLLLFAWIGVQRLWRTHFAATDRDGDVLAGRTGCGNCGCDTPCERRGGPSREPAAAMTVTGEHSDEA